MGEASVMRADKKHLGIYMVNFAFGLNDEREQSPNYSVRLSSFEKGQVAYSILLHVQGR